MQFSLFTPTSLSALRSDCLVLPVAGQPKRLGRLLAEANTVSGGLLKQLLDSGDFRGEAGQHSLLYLPVGTGVQRLLLIGSGTSSPNPRTQLQSWLKQLSQAIGKLPLGELSVSLQGLKAADDEPAWAARQLSQQLSTARYRYDTTLSRKADKPTLKKVRLLAEGRGLNAALKTGQAIAEGINLARELGNLPGNICTPVHLASEARKLARQQGLHCQVLDEKRLEALGAHSLLSVARGSRQPARLIVLEYRGAAKAQAPVVLVGKGITFDTGGISLKPGAKMDEMKYDMCGAASVLGTLSTAARLKLPLNLVGIIAAAENMPDGQATKPGDVVTSLAGKTIEILNTDAEGRLVLCDALTYAARFKPDTVIDIATLTGACVVALGEHASGLFSNDDDLAEDLLAAGQRSGDRAWRLPIWDDYRQQLKSPFADLANIGGPSAGSITAACFLSHFTENYRWAHLDIAGTAWSSSPKAATGRPVGLLSDYLLARCGLNP